MTDLAVILASLLDMLPRRPEHAERPVPPVATSAISKPGRKWRTPARPDPHVLRRRAAAKRGLTVVSLGDLS